jgi:predicted transcriptional regulator
MPSASLTLSAQLSRRVQKLAQAAGRTPESMLRFVIRDGLDYCEYAVKSVNEGLADIDAGRAYSGQNVREHFAKRRTSRRDKKATWRGRRHLPL